jgi:hypothetical protein
MSEVPPDPELRAIESALKGLVPLPSRLDRDRSMYQAGQILAKPRSLSHWVWPSVAASLALVALSEAAMLAVRREPRVVERVVIVREPAAQPAPVVILSQAPSASSSEAGHSWGSESESVQLHRNALQFGLDGLPEPPPLLTRSGVGGAPAPQETLRRFDYPKALDPGGPS